MSEGKSRRGRPIGTGIDDRPRLQSIAELIAAHPGLAPTTAIKSLGVSDPSVIRRLRDKFNLMREELMRDLAAAEPPHGKPRDALVGAPGGDPAPRRSATTARTAALSVGAPRSSRKSANPKGGPVSQAGLATDVPPQVPLAPTLATPPASDPARALLSFCALGLRAMSAVAGAQLALLEQTTRMPHVTIALRQQMAFGELAMAFYAPSARPRQTVH